MALSRWDVQEHIRTIIRSRAEVDIGDLLNRDISLELLAASTGAQTGA